MKVSELFESDASIDPSKFYLAWPETGSVLKGPFDTFAAAQEQKAKEIHKKTLSIMSGKLILAKLKIFGG